MMLPAHRKPSRHKGFSLIELMAVLVVVGMALGMIAVSIGHGGPEKQLYDKLDEFLTQSRFASEQATLSGEALGLLVEPPQWQVTEGSDLNINEVGWRITWERLGQRGWEPIAGLGAMQLPPDIHLEISLSGKRWEWSKYADHVTPIIALSPTGEVTPFVIAIHHKELPDPLAHVEVSEEGEIVWREAQEDEKKRKEKL